MALSVGTRLGVYEIQSPLGTGGMGEVYRARDTTLNRDVAIKVPLPAVANDPDRLARFSREAQMLASLITRTSRRSMASKMSVACALSSWSWF